MGRFKGKYYYYTILYTESDGCGTQPKNSESVKKDSRPPPRSTHPRPTTDPDAIRTIVISGLPSLVDSKTLWKKFRKYNGAEKLEWPLKNESGEEDQSTGESDYFFLT